MFSFSKEKRLIKDKDFKAVLSASHQRLQSSRFIYYIKKNNFPTNRLGIIASRQVGKANVRNRVKRLIREFWRREQTNFCFQKSKFDLVVIAKRGVFNKETNEIFKELDGVFRKSFSFSAS